MGEPEAEIARLIREYRDKTAKSVTIGTVESATGGRIADRITNIPGSSDYFRGSVVAYSNEVKIVPVGVNRATLERYGAVSKEVAVEMASGGRKLLDIDICVSDTGIAGPAGAAPGKPLGLFFVGLAAGDEAFSQKYVFPGDREENKEHAAEAALNLLRQYLLTQLNKSKKAV
jgi:PncC family amidohydrolase